MEFLQITERPTMEQKKWVIFTQNNETEPTVLIFPLNPKLPSNFIQHKGEKDGNQST